MLRTLLIAKDLTVVDLDELLRARGIVVNRKSLYRLTSPRPIQKLDTTIVRGICEVLEVSLEELIRFEKPKFELLRLEQKLQEELDGLIHKNNGGKLTTEEEDRFNRLLEEAQRVTVKNSKILATQSRLRTSGR